MELLISVLLILALSALILAAVRRMGNKAERVIAVSVLKQVADANAAFTAENSGDINTVRFPDEDVEGDLPDDTVTNAVNNSFWGRCQPYLFLGITDTSNPTSLRTDMKRSLAQLFSTPNFDTMAKTVMSDANIYRDGSDLSVPYSFNLNLSPKDEWRKAVTIDNPSRVIWAAYGRGKFQPSDGASYVPYPKSGTSTGDAPPPRIYFFEDRKAIVAFLDGHVEELRPPFAQERFE